MLYYTKLCYILYYLILSYIILSFFSLSYFIFIHSFIHSFICQRSRSIRPCWAAQLRVLPSRGSEAHQGACIILGARKWVYRVWPQEAMESVDETRYVVQPWGLPKVGRCSHRRTSLEWGVVACNCRHTGGRFQSWTKRPGSGHQQEYSRCEWHRPQSGTPSKWL